MLVGDANRPVAFDLSIAVVLEAYGFANWSYADKVSAVSSGKRKHPLAEQQEQTTRNKHDAANQKWNAEKRSLEIESPLNNLLPVKRPH